MGDHLFSTNWHNVGPRVAVAWNPTISGGILEKIFGNKKTVIRGGYGMIFDRQTTVWSVVEPMLGPAFAQTLNCRGPLMTGTCAGSSDPTNAYRIGIDGPGLLPTFPVVTSPVVIGSPYGETLAYQDDPHIGNGYVHNFNFTVQRELSSGVIIELGYAGKLGRNLSQTMDINSVPYMMKDPKSSQTFAQAWDALANQLRGGTVAGSVTPQPWFENEIGAGGTVKLATSQSAGIQTGQLRTVWNAMQLMLPTPITNTQVQTFWNRTDGGYSNYQAGFISFRKRASHGLTLDANYTFSKSLDLAGAVQNSPYEYSNSYFPRLDYGPSGFDRKHTFNASLVYELPAGKGHRFSTHSLGDKLIGGWYLAGIIIANSGLPLTVVESNNAYGGGDTFNYAVSGAVPLGPIASTGVHSGITGSGGVATTGNPATHGSGLNMFANPAAVLADFRPIEISQDSSAFKGDLRGFPFWNVDLSTGKRTFVTEKFSFLFTADFLNAFNHVIFNNPSLNMFTPQTFGVITSQFNQPRAIQLALRVEF
jgi:hypothetical protein